MKELLASYFGATTLGIIGASVGFVILPGIGNIIFSIIGALVGGAISQGLY